MDLGSIKFGLGIAAVGLSVIFVSFALYFKMGEKALKKARIKKE